MKQEYKWWQIAAFKLTGTIGGFITSITVFESNLFGGIFFAIVGLYLANRFLSEK